MTCPMEEIALSPVLLRDSGTQDGSRTLQKPAYYGRNPLQGKRD
jgi:hypothetical protein